ncbi:MAG: RNA methyltransferase [Actinobacteria bacterium]|jgi:TrmH family RNA methyltransferase|nr:RNA methyltransferase [Actinomycetota bacterium]
MTDLHITSATNPRLKALVRLRRRRARDEAGVTLAEGFEELELAVAAGVRPRTLFHCRELMLDPERQERLVDELRARGVETISLSRAAFEKVAYREGPDGFLAVLPALGVTLEELDLPDRPFLLVAEGIEKPGNLGAMLRSAEAAGADAVIAVDPVTDWGNPNVVRGSKGAVYAVPVASTTLGALLPWLAARGIRLIATTPDTEVLHTQADLTGGVAIAVGTEKYGLTDAFLAGADAAVRIPMAGQINSLNAGVAAAIVLFEAVRQRQS